ncbi:MAG: MFS transporter [Planctomycetota bacterium]
MSLAELCGMALWFSASASVPVLRVQWQLDDRGAAWLTLAVQIGFVAGTLSSALFNLADVMDARRLFALSATLGALVNAAFALCARGLWLGLPLRFLTGVFLAGVYPPGMKLIATWFLGGRGLAIGVLIGALTLGKASPYLINGIGDGSWRHSMLIVSVLALCAAVIVGGLVPRGPYALPNARFDRAQIGKVIANRGVRLASLGYFGHMWELYAMWTWAPVMLRASLQATGGAARMAELAAFLVIGAGALGCVAGGWLADRVGRTLVTSWAMAASGACCVLIGPLFGLPSPWLLSVAAIWGATVVADSAQFSTCVTELGDPQYLGTALTLQTCVGFLLTTASIELIGAIHPALGWRYAFLVLAPGPWLGVLAMLRLRSLPEAAKLARGRR